MHFYTALYHTQILETSRGIKPKLKRKKNSELNALSVLLGNNARML